MLVNDTWAKRIIEVYLKRDLTIPLVGIDVDVLKRVVFLVLQQTTIFYEGFTTLAVFYSVPATMVGVDVIVTITRLIDGDVAVMDHEIFMNDVLTMWDINKCLS